MPSFECNAWQQDSCEPSSVLWGAAAPDTALTAARSSACMASSSIMRAATIAAETSDGASVPPASRSSSCSAVCDRPRLLLSA